MKKTTPLQTAPHVMHHIGHLLSSQDTLTTQGQTPEQHALEQTTGAHGLIQYTTPLNPKTKRPALRSMALLLLTLLGLGVGEVMGQTSGDYRSKANPAGFSSWANNSAWEKYNGTAWVIGGHNFDFNSTPADVGWTLGTGYTHNSAGGTDITNVVAGNTSGGSLRYTGLNTDSWAYIKFNLMASVTYTLGFAARTSSATTTNHRIHFAIGTAIPSGSHGTYGTNLYNAQVSSANINAWFSGTGSATFTPSTSGEYYLGIFLGSNTTTRTVDVDNIQLVRSTTEVPASANTVNITILNGHTVTQAITNYSSTGNVITVNQGGTLIYTSATAFNFNTLTVDGTFVRRGLAASIPTINSTGVYRHDIDGGTIPSITWPVGSTLEITGVTSTVPTATGTYRNVIWNCTGQGSTALVLETNLNTIQGDFTLKSTGSSSVLVLGNTTTARTMTVNNDFIIEGGNFALKGASVANGVHILNVKGKYNQSGGVFTFARTSGSTTNSTLELEGDFEISNGTIQNSTNTDPFGTIIFKKSGEQVYSKTGGTFLRRVNIQVFANSILNMGTSIIDGSTGTFNLDSGAGIITANTAGITSSGASGSIQVTGTRTYSTGANYTYNGTVAQNTGNGLPATVNNLTIDNTHASGVSLTNNVTVSSNLSIGFGSVFNLATNTLGGSTLTTSGTGKLQTQNTTATPIPAGRTWSFEVEMNANSAQTVPQGNYATLRLNTGGTKTISDNTAIAGDLIVENATATVGNNIAFSGSSAQSIAGLAYNNIAFSNAGTKTFISNASVSPTSEITFTGTPGAVDFDGADNILEFVLQSTSGGTARVGEVPTGWTLNGRVRAERFIPARRAWRLLTAPLKGNSSNSIFANWQGTNNEGLLLWNPTGTASPSSQNTGLYLGPQPNIWSYTGTAWSAVANTNDINLFETNSNNAFLVFATGPYGSDNITSGVAATTTRATGSLITGNVEHSLTANQFKLIGNPYASPLDTEAMLADSDNSGSKIWLLDPTNGLGAYITYDGNWSIPSPTNNNKYIQSGQAFFIRRNSTSFIVKETHKVAGNSNNWFERNANNITNSESSDKIRVLLYKQVANTWQFADGALAVNSSNGNNEVDDTDAGKIANFNESLSFRNGTTNLSIEYRALPEEGDTQPIRLTATTAIPYQLRLYVENYTNSSLQPFLENTQTGALTTIPTDGSTVEIPFTGVVSNANNPDNRFRIVYQSTLSIDNPTVSNFGVYPNPVENGQFQIDFVTLPDAASYSITTLLGQQVQEGTLSNTQNTLTVNNLAKGIYLLQVTQDNKVTTKKLYIH